MWYNIRKKNETVTALESLLILLYTFVAMCGIGVILVIIGEISKLFSA